MNQGLPQNIPLYNGYDPLSSGRYWNFVNARSNEGNWRGPYEPVRLTDTLRVAGVTHLIQLTLSGPPVLPRLRDGITVEKEASIDNWTLWRLHYPGDSQVWPDAYQTAEVYRESDKSYLELLRSRLHSRLQPPAVFVDLPELEFADGAHARPPKLPAPKPLFQSPTLREWSITGQESIFVHNETLAPGWKAYVDGKPAPLNYGNYLFRAVSIPQGAKKVTLVFDSWTQRTGLFITLCGLMGIGIWAGTALGGKLFETAPSTGAPKE
jgi:hypothetical protein